MHETARLGEVSSRRRLAHADAHVSDPMIGLKRVLVFDCDQLLQTSPRGSPTPSRGWWPDCLSPSSLGAFSSHADQHSFRSPAHLFLDEEIMMSQAGHFEALLTAPSEKICVATQQRGAATQCAALPLRGQRHNCRRVKNMALWRRNNCCWCCHHGHLCRVRHKQ